MTPLSQTLTESPITNLTAVGAITSPIWLQSLSHIAAIILPILGVAWLSIQIGHWFWLRRQRLKRRRKKP